MARNDAVGKARYETEVDPSGLKKGLDGAERAIKSTGATTERAFAQQATGAVGKFTGGITGLVGKINGVARGGGIGGALLGGIGLGAGLSAFNLVQGAITGALDKVGQGIQLASDKAEAASKAQILFGDSYKVIEDASRSAATAVGMSSGAYLSAAGDLGNLLKNFDLAEPKAADMSKSMIQLAADMGSFNNADPTEVVEAMGAAFRGESEPIRRFGVMLSAAKVEAKAMAMGLKDGKKPLDDQAKALATYQLILDQTTAAQGDFARTSGEMANRQRIDAARSEEAMTKLGEAVKPLAMELMPALAEASIVAVEALTSLVRGVKDLWGFVRDVDEFFKPWQREARLAAEETQTWADELAAMPESAGIARTQLESIARRAKEAGTGLAGAKEELIDLVRWVSELNKGDVDDLATVVRTYERLSAAMADGSLSAEQLQQKMSILIRHPGIDLDKLMGNLDLMPDKLAAMVRYVGSGQEAVDIFARKWLDLAYAVQRGDKPWQQMSRFLMDNEKLIREHWALLPDYLRQILKQSFPDIEQFGQDLQAQQEIWTRQIPVAAVGGMFAKFLAAAQGPLAAFTAAVPGIAAAQREAWERAGTGFAFDLAGGFEKGVKGSKPDLQSAILELRDMLNFDWGAEAGYAMGAEFMKNVRRGFDSGVPELEQRAEEASLGALTAMDHAQRTGPKAANRIGNVLAELYASGLSRGEIEARLAAEGVSLSALERIASKKGWHHAGGSVAGEWVQGVEGKKKPAGTSGKHLNDSAQTAANDKTGWNAGGAAVAASWASGFEGALNRFEERMTGPTGPLARLSRAFVGESPPPEGPLREIDKGGWNVGRAWRQGFLGGISISDSDVARSQGWGAGIAGWSLTASATQTVNHQHGGRVEVALSGDTMAAARSQGASWDDVARMAAAAGSVIADARQMAGLRFTSPRRV